jgi:hypothetical protein
VDAPQIERLQRDEVVFFRGVQPPVNAGALVRVAFLPMSVLLLQLSPQEKFAADERGWNADGNQPK